MVVNKGKDITFTLQLIMSDTEPDTGATVSYTILDSTLSEVVTTQSATYNTTTESYVDVLDITSDWSDQEIGTYAVIWSISDTSDDFPSVMTEDLQVTIDPDDIKRILGLIHENMIIDNTGYDRFGNLTSARLRIYSTSASVGTDNNVLATYQITAQAGTDIGKFTTWRQVEV